MANDVTVRIQEADIRDLTSGETALTASLPKHVLG